MARSNGKRRQAGVKFDGYIYIFFFPRGGGGPAYSYCIKKRKKDEKGEKKNQEKVFKMGHL